MLWLLICIVVMSFVFCVIVISWVCWLFCDVGWVFMSFDSDSFLMMVEIVVVERLVVLVSLIWVSLLKCFMVLMIFVVLVLCNFDWELLVYLFIVGVYCVVVVLIWVNGWCLCVVCFRC